jgi:hypothetical protein
MLGLHKLARLEDLPRPPYQSGLLPVTSLKGSSQQRRRPNHIKGATCAARGQEKGRKHNTVVRNVELRFV